MQVEQQQSDGQDASHDHPSRVFDRILPGRLHRGCPHHAHQLAKVVMLGSTEKSATCVCRPSYLKAAHLTDCIRSCARIAGRAEGLNLCAGHRAVELWLDPTRTEIPLSNE